MFHLYQATDLTHFAFPGFDRFYLGLFRIVVCILENCGLYLVSIFEKNSLYLVCNAGNVSSHLYYKDNNSELRAFYL